MWFFKLIESFFKRERGEQGSGLMTVLGVSLVVTIAAGTITSSIVMASNFTSEKLSQQQADAAAEAGIADAVHIYQTGNCVASSPMHDSPKYKYNFYRSNSENYPTTKGEAGTYAGCPGDSGEGSGSKADRWVMIESTGYGKNNTSKAKTAVFKINPANMSVIPQAITASQVDLKGGFSLNKAPGSTIKPSIYMKDSAYNNISSFFKCASNSIINANVKYESKNSFNEYEGGVSTQDCTINGNLNIDTPSTPNIDLSNLTVNGDVCSKQTSIPSASAKHVAGKLYKTTDCSTEGTRYGYVPDMTDSFAADPESCTDWASFSEQIKEVSGKNNGENNILDLTNCGATSTDASNFAEMMYVSVSPYRELIIDGDITLVFNKYFKLRNTSIKSSKENHEINFVVSAKDADSSDSAYPSGVGTSTFTNVVYEDGTSGMVYTPYSFQTYYNTVINGQIYAGKQYISQTSSAIVVNYTPVGLPNAEKKIKDIGRAPDLIRVY